jgi:hypothetical protein
MFGKFDNILTSFLFLITSILSEWGSFFTSCYYHSTLLGFDRLNAVQIEASYALWNKSSQRVLEKIGMKFIEYIPHSFQKKGRWIESNKMSINQQEWREHNTFALSINTQRKLTDNGRY